MKTKKRWGSKGFALFLALSPAAAFAESTDAAGESQQMNPLLYGLGFL